MFPMMGDVHEQGPHTCTARQASHKGRPRPRWLGDADGRAGAGLPVLVHAAACASGDWNGYVPACIDLPAVLDHWLPEMGKLGVRVDVFPATGRRGLMVPALELKLQLREQLMLI